ncbi:MAG: PAS domain S-box protein [Pseudomonadota bacterium]
MTEDKSVNQEQNLCATLCYLGYAVISIDKDGHITQMNPAAEYLTGSTSESARGKPLANIIKIKTLKVQEKADQPADKTLGFINVAGFFNHATLLSKQARRIHAKAV